MLLRCGSWWYIEMPDRLHRERSVFYGGELLYVFQPQHFEVGDSGPRTEHMQTFPRSCPAVRVRAEFSQARCEIFYTLCFVVALVGLRPRGTRG